jgi:hypothetical protein
LLFNQAVADEPAKLLSLPMLLLLLLLLLLCSTDADCNSRLLPAHQPGRSSSAIFPNPAGHTVIGTAANKNTGRQVSVVGCSYVDGERAALWLDAAACAGRLSVDAAHSPHWLVSSLSEKLASPRSSKQAVQVSPTQV